MAQWYLPNVCVLLLADPGLFFKPVQFHFQPTDFGIESLGAGRRIIGLGAALAVKNSWRLRQQCFLPYPNLGRVDRKLLGNFIQGLCAPNCFKCYFCLVLTGEAFTILFAQCLLLFIAGYHLKLLSGFWGPL